MIVEPRFPSTPRRAGPWHAVLVVAIGLLVALSSFAAGILAERDLFTVTGLPGLDGGRGRAGLAGDALAGPDFPLLEHVQSLIEGEYFYRPADPEQLAAFRRQLDVSAIEGVTAGIQEDPPSDPAEFDVFLRDLEYDAIQGVTASLEDDYTAFLIPQEQAPVAEQMSGEYEGIGVHIDHPEGRLTVVAPIPGTPAERAGIVSGDVIEQADGRSLEGLSPEDAGDLIRGPAGTTVRLTIRRPGRAEPLTIDVVRQKITTEAVLYDPLAEGAVGWIRVTIFNDKTTGQLDAALKQATEDGVRGVVLDLRNNGGGWVHSAQEMIGRFVAADQGAALYEDDDASPDNEPRAEPILGGEEVFDLPLVVLVNEGTASAAEIVAGALRDYDRGLLIGTPTFGKGSVQRVHDFEDGSSLRVTFAQWLTPDRQPIPEEGLAPDITVEVPSGLPGGADPQRDRAVQEVLASSTR